MHFNRNSKKITLIKLSLLLFSLVFCLGFANSTDAFSKEKNNKQVEETNQQSESTTEGKEKSSKTSDSSKEASSTDTSADESSKEKEASDTKTEEDSDSKTKEDSDAKEEKEKSDTEDKKDSDTKTEDSSNTKSEEGSDTKAEKEPQLKVNSKLLYTGYEKFTIKLKNLTEKAKVTFKSSDKKVAKVTQKGVITPKGAGEAIITVTIKQNKQKYVREFTVTVKDPYYEVTKSADGIHIGESFTYQIKRYGYKGEVNWTLSEGYEEFVKAKSTKEYKIKITAKKEGMVTLFLESNGVITEFPIYLVEGSGDVFVISEDKLPYNNRYLDYGTYNKKTKYYYIVRSYLEKLNNKKGGTLIFLPGKYTITNTLTVPSNTQIILFDGATIKKSYETGTSGLTATRSLFQLVSNTSAAREGIYSGYSGEHDIKFIGKGNATIDLDYLNTCAIMLCHNKNVLIKGITFKNMNTNHFIELDASTNVVIEDNIFTGHKDSENNNKEAINIDTPDRNTGGFNQLWTSFDCTPNSDILIQNNIFSDLECGVGTHKYSQDKAHVNIVIANNLFEKCDIFAIQAMNWDFPCIIDNTFEFVAANYDECATILLKGVRNPLISNNTFKNLEYVIEAFHWQNSGKGKNYEITYNDFSEDDIALMKKNFLENVEKSYFIIFPDFGDYENNLRIEYFEADYIK